MAKKIAQTAVEFIILIAFLLSVFTAFFLLIQSNMSDTINQRKSISVKNLAIAVQDEINLASDSTDGYQRVFSLPDKIGNSDYEINLTEGFVYIRTSDKKNSIALPVRNVSGEVMKGDNIISKNSGIVRIEQ
jgi:hypothetical protein